MNYTLEKANSYIKENKDKVNKRHRHNFHLMPEVGWMNDPNGLNFYNGEYHVFYQFYPYDSKWGPMHWAHAKSKDLLNFEHLPVALAPDLPHEDGCFSGGSAILDNKLYLLYTSHFETGKKIEEQSIAISEDGINFKKYGNKPVLSLDELPEGASKLDFRDPNPVTIDGKNFVLIGSAENNIGQFLIYESNDYIKYNYVNKIGPNPLFGTMAECPDFFYLDGKYVLLFSSTSLPTLGNRYKNVNSSLYMIGDFDSKTGEFKIEHHDELDLGHHFYAPQSFLNDKNERIMIAWMEMWGKPYYTDLNGDGWVGAMTLGRKLRVVNNRLVQEPIETNSILNKEIDLSNLKEGINLSKTFHLNMTLKGNTKLDFITDENNVFSLEQLNGNLILDTEVSSETEFEKRYIDDFKGEEIIIDMFVDVSSIEVFIKGHDKTITTRFYTNSDNLTLKGYNLENIKDIKVLER